MKPMRTARISFRGGCHPIKEVKHRLSEANLSLLRGSRFGFYQKLVIHVSTSYTLVHMLVMESFLEFH